MGISFAFFSQFFLTIIDLIKKPKSNIKYKSFLACNKKYMQLKNDFKKKFQIFVPSFFFKKLAFLIKL